METPQKNIQKWEPHFKQRIELYASVPVERRTCTDIYCLVVFIFILVSFLVLSTWSILYYNKIPMYYIAICIGFAVASYIFSIIFACLTRCIPKFSIYFSVLLIIITLIALITYGFINKYIGLAIISIILLIIFVILFFFCWRQKIENTILLLKISRKFLSENSSSYWNTLLITILSIIIMSILIAQVSSCKFLYQEGNISQAVFGVIVFFDGCFYVFSIFYFYYLTTFLIGSASSIWYFRGRSDCCAGFGWSFSHIGTITYASIMITTIKIFNIIIDPIKPTSQQNCCSKFCSNCYLMLISTCLKCYQGLLQTLNHNSIFITALSGQDYQTGAKSAIVIISSNYDIFSAVTNASGFIFYMGIFFSAVLPGILCIISLAKIIQYSITYMIITIAFSLMISPIVVTKLSESLNAVFLYHFFEQKLIDYGQKPSYQSKILNQNDIREETNIGSISPRSLICSIIALINPKIMESARFQPLK